MTVAPDFRNTSFDPVCSRCQSVLKTVLTGCPLNRSPRNLTRSVVRSGRLPLTSRRPSGWERTKTFPPVPVISVRSSVSGVAVMDESPVRGREIAAAAPNNVLTKSLRLEKSMDLKFILKYLIWQGYVMAGLEGGNSPPRGGGRDSGRGGRSQAIFRCERPPRLRR